jgi:hypothetical protein
MWASFAELGKSPDYALRFYQVWSAFALEPPGCGRWDVMLAGDQPLRAHPPLD